MSKRVKAIYTKEFRAEAVKLVTEQGLGVLDASKRLGMPLATLASWVTSAKAGKLASIDSGRKVDVTDQAAEIKRLQKELAQTQMERDILKNRPTRLAAPLLNRNSGELYCKDRRILAVSFLEVSTPSKNLAWV